MATSKYDQLKVAKHALSKLTKEGERYAGLGPELEGISETKYHEKPVTRRVKGIYFFKEGELVEYNGKEIFVTIEEYEDSLLELASAKLAPLLASSPAGIAWEYAYVVMNVRDDKIDKIVVNGVDISEYRHISEFASSPLAYYHTINKMLEFLNVVGGWGWDIANQQIFKEGITYAYHITLKRRIVKTGISPSDQADASISTSVD